MAGTAPTLGAETQALVQLLRNANISTPPSACIQLQMLLQAGLFDAPTGGEPIADLLASDERQRRTIVRLVGQWANAGKPIIAADTGSGERVTDAPGATPRTTRRTALRTRVRRWRSAALNHWRQHAHRWRDVAIALLIPGIGTALYHWKQDTTQIVPDIADVPLPPIAPEPPPFNPSEVYYSWEPAIELSSHTLLPLLLSLLWAGLALAMLALWRRYEDPLPAPVTIPDHYPNAITSRSLARYLPPAPALTTQEIDLAYGRLNAVWQDEDDQQLDLQRTVNSTASNAGLLTLQWRAARQQRKIAFLWDKSEPASAIRNQLQNYRGALQTQGLDIHWDEFTDHDTLSTLRLTNIALLHSHEDRGTQWQIFLFSAGARLQHGRCVDANCTLRLLAHRADICWVDTSSRGDALCALLAGHGLHQIIPWRDFQRHYLDLETGTANREQQLQRWRAAACLAAVPLNSFSLRELRDALQLDPALQVEELTAASGLRPVESSGLTTWQWPLRTRQLLIDQLATNAGHPPAPHSDLQRALLWWHLLLDNMLQRCVPAPDQYNRQDDPVQVDQWRLRLEKALLDLYTDPDRAAQSLLQLKGLHRLHGKVRTRLRRYLSLQPKRNKVSNPRDAPRARLPIDWDTLSRDTRVRLQTLGFSYPHKAYTPRLSPRSRAALGWTLGAAITGLTLNFSQPAYDTLQLAHTPGAFASDAFLRHQIVQSSEAGLLAGNAKQLKFTDTADATRARLNWTNSWIPRHNPEVFAGGAIWYAGQLAQRPRACAPGWPVRSFLIIDAEPDDTTAQQFAALWLDHASADKVLISRQWQQHLQRFDPLHNHPATREVATQWLLLSPSTGQLPKRISAAPFAVASFPLNPDNLQQWRNALEQLHGNGTLAATVGNNIGLAGVGVAGDSTMVRINGGPLRTQAKHGIYWQHLCGGTFTQGSDDRYQKKPQDDSHKADDDEALHTVVVLSPFQFMTNEMTSRQYADIRSEKTLYDGLTPAIAEIDWQQSSDTCSQIDASLPSESQWEYAARGGSQTAWFWGDDETLADRHSAARDWNGDFPQTPPNLFGIYDTTAGLWEWVQDGYREQYDNTTVQVDPLNKGASVKVIRGGTFDGDAWVLRSADRGWRDPGVRGVNLGFRCVRVPSASDRTLNH